ncbi:calpain-B-like [Chironomus tepperi]|uniref:calpain-B-like n=1 Tax=Chironomus tepperi TaxID=113505 RepID=UPI00391F5C06
MVKQDFYSIRRNCYEKGILFEDPEFPLDNSHLPLFDVPGKPKKVVEWKRPGEICINPEFFVNNFSRFDVKQGHIGDCWFLAAVTNLTLNPQLFNRVVCRFNSFVDNYAGIFHFHFWSNDAWESVVIDDRLPTHKNKLLFAKSTDENEFWIALLEKAFAKFKGSYKVLVDYGTICEAAEDLTGGISEKFCVKQSTSAVPHCSYMHICYDDLVKSFMGENFMGCFIRNQRGQANEIRTSDQLVRGHAFSITGVKRFGSGKFGNTEEIRLLRLRNPWGTKCEWTGEWSDNCPKWNGIPNNIKDELGFRKLYDGEFWMSYEDFHKNFDVVEICSLSAKTLLKLTEECCQKMRKKVLAIQKYSEKLDSCIDELCNDPRYILTFTKNSLAIVSIIQTNTRQLMVNHSLCKDFLLPMGLIIRKISDDTKNVCLQKEMTKKCLTEVEKFDLIENFYSPRHTQRIHNISPGKYVVIPYTKHQNANFFIRIFSEAESHLKMKKLLIFLKFLKHLCMRKYV